MNLIRTDLTPQVIAQRIDSMGWTELDPLAHELLGRMRFVAEAPGVKLQPTQIAHGKPGASAPRAVPWCRCGHASLYDHHEDDLRRASVDDLSREDQHPVRFRSAILRAAQGLWDVGHRPIASPHAPNADDAGVDRSERIITEYVGLSPETVAGLESARAGWISAESVRRLRSRCELHAETGEDSGATREELRQHALALYYGDGKHTYRSIGALVGVSHTTVMRWCSPADVDKYRPEKAA